MVASTNTGMLPSSCALLVQPGTRSSIATDERDVLPVISKQHIWACSLVSNMHCFQQSANPPQLCLGSELDLDIC
jgi:hypothetical protein